MRPSVMRGAVLVLMGLLAACGPTTPPSGPQTVAPAPAMCTVGPDGGPAMADRGIGGTGAPLREADRGIGGTGSPLLASGGIGGTGIVAVITGFASVCLAGQEVSLPPDVPVSIESQPASPNALRAGQVAAVEAVGTGGGLSAARIAVRYEVSGPVEAATADTLRVAGQHVLLEPQTWGVRPRVGDWVSVSGLRRPDDTILATRVDRREPGEVMVRGMLRDDSGTLRLGALNLQPAPGLAALSGQEVTAVGTLASEVLVPTSIVPDVLAMDPAAFFGPAVGTFYVEGFAVIEGGRLHLGRASLEAAPGLSLGPGSRAILRLERAGGGLRAVGFGPRGELQPGRLPPARQFEPAPVPNRAMRSPDARFGRPGLAGPRSGSGQRDGGRQDGFGRREDGPGYGGFAPGGFGPSGFGSGGSGGGFGGMGPEGGRPR